MRLLNESEFSVSEQSYNYNANSNEAFYEDTLKQAELSSETSQALSDNNDGKFEKKIQEQQNSMNEMFRFGQDSIKQATESFFNESGSGEGDKKSREQNISEESDEGSV
jgi:hypothetical protein